MKSIFWLFSLGIIGFLLYFYGLDGQYYMDDFGLVFEPLNSNPFYYFIHKKYDNDIFYRPLENLFLALVQKYFGLNTIPLHLTQLSIHILFSWVIFFVIGRLGFSKFQAMLGSLFMIVSQTNVVPVLSNDTLSQVGGTFFGCISVWLLYSCFLNSKTRKPGFKKTINYQTKVFSILAFIISLLFKESSVSFIPLLLVIIILINLEIKNYNLLIKKTIFEISPYLIVTVLYIIIRLLIGASLPNFDSNSNLPSHYKYQISINIIKNIVMFLFAALIPTSSVTTFTAFKNREYVNFCIIVITSFLFLALIAYGLWRSNRRGTISVLVVFAIINFFPMAMMNQVSEHQLYNSIPFISILVGIGLGKQLELSKVSWAKQGLVAALVGLLFVSNATAVPTKALFMKENGERATMLLIQIQPYVYKLPKNGKLLLLNPPSNQVEYSVFLLKGFNVLREDGLQRIKKVSGRNDLMMKIIEISDVEQFKNTNNSLILSLNRETVQIYQ